MKGSILDENHIRASILDAVRVLDNEGKGSAEKRLSDFKELYHNFKKSYDQLSIAKKELKKAFTGFNQSRAKIDPQRMKTDLVALSIGQRKYFAALLDLYTQKMDWVDSYELARVFHVHRSTVQRYLSGEYGWRGSKEIAQICGKKKEKNGRIKYKPLGFFAALARLHAVHCRVQQFLLNSQAITQRFYILAWSRRHEYREWVEKRLSLSDSFSNVKRSLPKMVELFKIVDKKLGNLTASEARTKQFRAVRKAHFEAREALGFLLDDPDSVALSSSEQSKLKRSLRKTLDDVTWYNLIATTQRVLTLKHNLESISKGRIGSDFMAHCSKMVIAPEDYNPLVEFKELLDHWLEITIPEVDSLVFSAQYGEAISENKGVYPLRELKRIQYNRMQKGEITRKIYLKRLNSLDSKIESMLREERESLTRMVDRSKSDV